MLREHREELYALSARTGATLFDSQLRHRRRHRRRARLREQGQARAAERERSTSRARPSRSARAGSSSASTSSRRCAASPCRSTPSTSRSGGRWRSSRPAFIAGVPSLVKPASQTAYLTARMVELIVESGPAARGRAAVRLRQRRRPARPPATSRTCVGFTGSASTAQRLRSHPSVVSRSVRFNAEADSLNCSILGPDAAPGTPEFDLYVKQLVTEMTVKAGQKCTAIRRAFVPAGVVDDVVDAVRARLAKVTVGNPAADESVRMGALASLEQREEVRRSLKALQSVATDRVRRPRARRGGRCRRRARRVHLADPAARRRRRPPRRCTRSRRSARCRRVIGYRDAADVVDLAARGRGSLAGSVVTGDADFAREVVLGVAPWHGRLLVLDQDDAAESTGHGSPMPMLVHGGPGRAGGGEELGGIRGVLHHMQRTADPGQPARARRGHQPLGHRRARAPRASTRSASRSRRCGSATPSSPARARSRSRTSSTSPSSPATRSTPTWTRRPPRANPFFDGRVAHGYLIVSFAAGLFVQPDPGPGAGQLRRRQPALPDARSTRATS